MALGALEATTGGEVGATPFNNLIVSLPNSNFLGSSSLHKMRENNQPRQILLWCLI